MNISKNRTTGPYYYCCKLIFWSQLDLSCCSVPILALSHFHQRRYGHHLHSSQDPVQPLLLSCITNTEFICVCLHLKTINPPYTRFLLPQTRKCFPSLPEHMAPHVFSVSVLLFSHISFHSLSKFSTNLWMSPVTQTATSLPPANWTPPLHLFRSTPTSPVLRAISPCFLTALSPLVVWPPWNKEELSH